MGLTHDFQDTVLDPYSTSSQIDPLCFPLAYSEYQSRQVRVVMIDNEPWFVAADVCKVLELSDPTMALTRLDPDEKAKFNLGYGSPANVVNEPGLYSLIMTSRKPSAKQFKRWVTHEVLPALLSTVRSRLIWEGGK